MKKGITDSSDEAGQGDCWASIRISIFLLLLSISRARDEGKRLATGLELARGTGWRAELLVDCDRRDDGERVGGR